METPEFDQVLLTNWLISSLEPICDADPIVLAKYVMALLQKDKPEKYLRQKCLKQLEIFLGKETSSFVDLLFCVIKDKSYENAPVAKCLRTKKEPSNVDETTKGEVSDKTERSVEFADKKKKDGIKIRISIKSNTEAEIISNNQLEASCSKSGGSEEKGGESALEKPEEPSSSSSLLSEEKSRLTYRRRKTRSSSSSGSSCSTCTDDSEKRRRNRSRRSRTPSLSRTHLSESSEDSSEVETLKSTHREKSKERVSRGSQKRLKSRSQQLINKYKLVPIKPESGGDESYYNPHHDVDLRQEPLASASPLPNVLTNPGFAPTFIPLTTGELSNAEETYQPLALGDRDTSETGIDEKAQAEASSHVIPEIWNNAINPSQMMNMSGSALPPIPSSLSSFYMEPYNPESAVVDSSMLMHLIGRTSFNQNTTAMRSLLGTNAPGGSNEAYIKSIADVMQRNAYKCSQVVDNWQANYLRGKKRENDGNWPNETNTRYNASNNATIVLGEDPSVPSVSEASQERSESNNNRTVLMIRKIPPRLNTIGALNKHFSRFGTVVYIQVCFENDPESALVQFSNSFEATAAIRSTEAIFNNRFIKVFWAKPNQAAQAGPRFAKNDESGATGVGVKRGRPDVFGDNAFNRLKHKRIVQRLGYPKSDEPVLESGGKPLEGEINPPESKHQQTESKSSESATEPAPPIRSIPIAERLRQVKLVQTYQKQLADEIQNQKHLVGKLEKAKTVKEKSAIMRLMSNNMKRINEIKDATLLAQEKLKPSLLTNKVNKNLCRPSMKAEADKEVKVETQIDEKEEEEEDPEEVEKLRTLLEPEEPLITEEDMEIENCDN